LPWDGYCFDLREQPKILETLVLWLHQEWLKQRRNGDQSASMALALRRRQMETHLNGDSIPVTLIAKASPSLTAPPLGCISLTRLSSPNTFPRKSLTDALWVSNLFVTPTARGCGVGTALLERAEMLALELKEPHLFLYTSLSRHYYLARGWRECLRKATPICDNISDLGVFKKDIFVPMRQTIQDSATVPLP
jgi:hypothetical protein